MHWALLVIYFPCDSDLLIHLRNFKIYSKFAFLFNKYEFQNIQNKRSQK